MHVNEFSSYLIKLANLIQLEFNYRNLKEPNEWPLEMDLYAWIEQLEAYADLFPTVEDVEAMVKKIGK